MGFFTNRWIIVEIDIGNIILVRKSKDHIILEKVVEGTDENSKETIAENAMEEYAIAIGSNNNIYILYQNKEGHLILNILKEEKVEEVQLTENPIPEVFELNILVKDKTTHIFYILRIIDEENKYRIYHHYYDGTYWKDMIVEEITVDKVLNPIRIEEDENSILFFYYNEDKAIELKEFNKGQLEWQEKKILVDTVNGKLFLDVLKKDHIIHLTYGEFINESLVIKYNRIDSNGNQREHQISNAGSPSYPNIIFFGNKMWITWVELNKVMSRYSIDEGETWEEPIYMWNKTKDIDFIRYQYLSVASRENTFLRYTFGSIYPEIAFVGFGNLANTTEVPFKGLFPPIRKKGYHPNI